MPQINNSPRTVRTSFSHLASQALSQNSEGLGQMRDPIAPLGLDGFDFCVDFILGGLELIRQHFAHFLSFSNLVFEPGKVLGAQTCGSLELFHAVQSQLQFLNPVAQNFVLLLEPAERLFSIQVQLFQDCNRRNRPLPLLQQVLRLRHQSESLHQLVLLLQQTEVVSHLLLSLPEHHLLALLDDVHIQDGSLELVDLFGFLGGALQVLLIRVLDAGSRAADVVAVSTHFTQVRYKSFFGCEGSQPLLVDVHVVDGKQDLPSQLVAFDQMEYVRLAVVHARVALTVLLQWRQVFLPHWVSHGDDPIFDSEGLEALSYCEWIAHFEHVETELHGMLDVFYFPWPSQAHLQFAPKEWRLIPFVLLLQPPQDGIIGLFPFLQRFGLTEITHNNPINRVIEHLLQTPVYQRDVLASMDCCKADRLVLPFLSLLEFLGLLQVSFGFVYGPLVALVGFRTVVFLEGGVLGEADEDIWFDDVDHAVVQFCSDLGVALVAFYLDFAIVLASSHAILLEEVVRSQIGEGVGRKPEELLDGHAFWQIGEGIDVVVEVAIGELKGWDEGRDVGGSEVVEGAVARAEDEEGRC